MTFQFKIGTIATISIECHIFFFNHRSYFLVKPWWILVIAQNCFMWNKITNNVKNSFGDNTNFFIDSSI